ncbi:MAG: hypothetical protein JRJ54_07995 [Deltaproteobacteria bacterium]|nr:hypothetical protein [Deltaproteobacteria bacterium]
MDISRHLMRYQDELIALRRDFHQHPELGMQEFRTAEKVADYLNACGMEVARMNVTGVVGLLPAALRGSYRSCPALFVDSDSSHRHPDRFSANRTVPAESGHGWISTRNESMPLGYEPKQETVLEKTP